MASYSITLISPPDNGGETLANFFAFQTTVDPGGGYVIKYYFDDALEGTYPILLNGTEDSAIQSSSWDSWYPYTVHTRKQELWEDGGEKLAESATWTFTKRGAGPYPPENPTPDDTAIEVDFSSYHLSWDDGGEAESYDVYIGDGESWTLVSEDQGSESYTTSATELASIFGEWPTTQTVWWYVVAKNDNGETVGDYWSFDTIAQINRVCIGSGGDFVLCLTTRGLYLSTNFGSSWTQKLPIFAEEEFDHGACSSDGTYILAECVYDGQMYRSANGGTSWGSIGAISTVDCTVNDIAMSSDGQFMAFVITNNDTPANSLFVSTDYGANWTNHYPDPAEVTWQSCSISDDGQIIGVAGTGYLYVTFNGGTTWKKQNPPAGHDWWTHFKVSGDGKVGIVVNTGDSNQWFKNSGWNETPTVSSTPLTSFARTFLDDTSAQDAAHTLGLGTSDSPTWAGATLTGLTATRLVATNASKALSSVSLTDHSLLIGSDTAAIASLGAATNGQLPIGSTGADPTLATLTAGEGIDITNGAGSITIDGEEASTTNKGVASFSDAYFSVDSGVVSLVSGGGLNHNDLGSIQGGTTSEYYHLTSARHTKLAAIADLAVTDGNFIVGNDTTWVAESGTTVRTSIGLGTTATPQFAGLGIGEAAGSEKLTVYNGTTSGQAMFVHASANGGDVNQKICNDFVGTGSIDETVSITLAFGAGATACTITAGKEEDFMSSANRSSWLKFQTRNNGTMIDALYITAAGKIGIGPTSPNEALEVTGKIRCSSAFNVGGTDGVSTTFLDQDGNTISVVGGIITAKTAP